MSGRISRAEFARRRRRMVAEQLAGRGVVDPRVLAAMAAVPRERFVPEDLRADAYEDRPLPIGQEATISQPYIVGYMSEKLGLLGGEKVLEVGTGSGYQAAVLSRLAREVWTVEIDEDLALRAGAALRGLGIRNAHLKVGDGAQGWPEHAPFDRVVLTCAVEAIPEPLRAQVRVGGWILAPVGPEGAQVLRQALRLPHGFQETDRLPVTFVPIKRKPS